MQQKFVFKGISFDVKVDGENLFFDAKAVLKQVYKYGTTFASQFEKKFPTVPVERVEGYGAPMWVNLKHLPTLLALESECNPENQQANEFVANLVTEEIYETYYKMGFLDFKPRSVIEAERLANERAAAEEAASRMRAIQEKDAAIADLTKRLTAMENAEAERVKHAKEKSAAGVNPAVRFMNDAWFPIGMGFVFMLTIASFMFEVLSETMEMSPYMNIFFSTTYSIFGLLCVIRGYQFEIGDVKINPLWVVASGDMILTAYHVRDLWDKGGMASVLAVFFVVIIAFMLKSLLDMTLKIRATYLVKGWLPKVE